MENPPLFSIIDYISHFRKQKGKKKISVLVEFQLPVTRAKSPNLNRRKSCSDALKSSPVEKGTCGRTTRHSIGVYKESKPSPTSTTPKSKSRVGVRSVNATSNVKGRPQKVKVNTENSDATDQGNADIGVES